MAGAGALACRLVVPLVALFETSLRLHTEVAADPVVVLTWKVTRFAVGLVALALVGHAVRSRWRGRRARVRSDEVVRSCEPSPLPGRR
jgi:hypothetical protein